jgi:xylulose-5-phosphate/fructose-6-phosphate phosphoketolase
MVTNVKEATLSQKALSPHLLNQLDSYWRAANYLSVGQIYLHDNPLLEQPPASR